MKIGFTLAAALFATLTATAGFAQGAAPLPHRAGPQAGIEAPQKAPAARAPDQTFKHAPSFAPHGRPQAAPPHHPRAPHHAAARRPAPQMAHPSQFHQAPPQGVMEHPRPAPRR